MNWGTVTVWNDGVNLYVKYSSTNGTFGTLHLWVGTDLTLIPSAGNPDNPVPGQFPNSFDATGLMEYTFTVPLADIPFVSCGSAVFVVAHAKMGSETAFGGCTAFNVNDPSIQGRWWYYTKYTVCCNNPVIERLGTAFAKGGYVFTTDPKSDPEKLPSLKLTQNRWGWAINLTAPQVFTSDIFVGAGLNNTTKALKVGTATINWDGTSATVTYDLMFPYLLEEVHVYAGVTKPWTIAPGLYGFTQYFDPKQEDFTTTLPLVSTGTGAWFILHGIVWGPTVVNI